MSKNYYVVNQVYQNNDGWVVNNVGNFTNKSKAIAHAKNNAQNFGGISHVVHGTIFVSYQNTAFHVVKID